MPQWRAGGREGDRSTGRRGMKERGVPAVFCTLIGWWRSLCFYIAAVSCAFKFVLLIRLHIHTTHVHACVNVHIGVLGLNTCTAEYRIHTHTHARTHAWTHTVRAKLACRKAEEGEATPGCVSTKLLFLERWLIKSSTASCFYIVVSSPNPFVAVERNL